MFTKKRGLILTAALVLSTASLATHAVESSTTPYVGNYIADVAKEHKSVADSYKIITEPVHARFDWLKDYGTASPATEVTIDGKKYAAFSGCEPHNCTNSSYVLLLDPESNEFVTGAVLFQNDDDTQKKEATPNPTDPKPAQDTSKPQTTVMWLGEYSYDYIPSVWRLFYPEDN